MSLTPENLELIQILEKVKTLRNIDLISQIRITLDYIKEQERVLELYRGGRNGVQLPEWNDRLRLDIYIKILQAFVNNL